MIGDNKGGEQMTQLESNYWKLQKLDIIEPILPLLNAKELIVGTDNLIRSPQNALSYNDPWIHIITTGGRRCYQWNRILFHCYGMLPLGCTKCWKVVVRPKTLADLFVMHELMVQMNRESKLGTELRPHVHGLYGCYFYNNSIEQGQESYHSVRKAVDKFLGKDTGVLLKRGCTEMEHKFGPSNQWTLTEQDVARQEYILSAFADPGQYEQSEMVKLHVARRWIEYACMNGDETYLRFTGGKPMYPEYVKYHEEAIDGEADDGAKTKAETKAVRAKRKAVSNSRSVTRKKRAGKSGATRNARGKKKGKGGSAKKVAVD
jgi:hypothetical protein